MKALKDYQPFLSSIFKMIVEEAEFEARDPLAEVIRNPRLVVVLNHSTPISWIPPICLLAEKICQSGGGDRIPRGIVDKFFFGIPILRVVAEQLTQSDRPQTFEEILESFKKNEQTDMVVFPEGAMTFFGDVRKVQPFRSPKFLEIAIRTQAPILLAVHRGTEEWNTLFPIPKEVTPYIRMVSTFFGRKMDEEQYLNLPINLKKVAKFSMVTKLYVPELYESDLSGDATERKEQIATEAEKIREVMQDLFDELGAQKAKPVTKTVKKKR